VFFVLHTKNIISTLYEVSNKIWAQPPPGRRKPRFTREQIAAAAIAIADQDGFAELSMRRIADALGAGTMTLYYYVRTKDDLLTLMDDALMAEVVAASTPLPAHWRSAIETISRAMRATFRKHTSALHALQGARIGPNGLAHIEQSLQALEGLRLTVPQKLQMLSIVDDYVFGTLLRDREDHGINPSSFDARAINEVARDYLAHGTYPILARLVGDREPIDAFREFAEVMAEAGRFEDGLAIVLDGFAAKYGLPDVPRARRASRRKTQPASGSK
jgi:AcrR family transcriptional regulator